MDRNRQKQEEKQYRSGQKRTESDINGQKPTVKDRNRHKHTKQTETDRNGQKYTEMDRIESKRSGLVNFSQVKPTYAKLGQI